VHLDIKSIPGRRGGRRRKRQELARFRISRGVLVGAARQSACTLHANRNPRATRRRLVKTRRAALTGNVRARKKCRHARRTRALLNAETGRGGGGKRERRMSNASTNDEGSRRYSAPTRLDTSTRDSVELSDALGIASQRQFRVPRTLREARSRNYRYTPVPFGQNSFIVDRPVTDTSFV